MATAIQRRRGTTTQHSSFTGLVGEITIDTTKNTVVVHDGSTAGGHPLAKESSVNALGGADITAVVAGNGLTGGATSGDATINVVGGDGITVTADAVEVDHSATWDGNFLPGANVTYDLGSSTARWNDLYLAGSTIHLGNSTVSIDSAGDIEVKDAANSSVLRRLIVDELHIGAGAGRVKLKANNGRIRQDNASDSQQSLDFGQNDTDDLSEGSSNLYFTNARADARITAALIDEDNMASDSATRLPSQQSVKAYVDSQVATKDALSELSGDTDDITEGSTNLYYTYARADARITNATVDEDDMSSNSATLLPSQQSVKTYVDAQVATKDALSELSGDTDDISEGSTNLYYTNARADARISNAIVDEDNMASNSATQVPSQQSVKAYVDAQVATKDALSELSGDSDDITEGSTNLFLTGGTQTIAGAKTFSSDAIFSGNLTVNGTQTIMNTTVASLADNIVELNRDASGAPSENAGLQVNRGSSSDVFLQWNETSDVWQFTNDGSTYYSIATDTDDLSEGSTNLYYTNARADARIALQVGTNLDLSNQDTDDLSEGSSALYFTNARARAAISVSGDLSYNSSTGVISFTNDAGDIEGVTAGTGLTGGGTSGTVTVSIDDTGVSAATYGDADSVASFTVNAQGQITAASSVDIAIASSAVSGLAASATTDTTDASQISSGTLASARLPDLAVSDFAASAIQLSSESFSDSNSVLMTAAAIDDRIESKGYSTTTGTVTSVSGGNGLTGSVTGSGSLNVGSGYGITVNADDIEINNTAIRAQADIALSASDTGDLSEGSNLYFTNERVDDRINAMLTAGTGLSKSYDDAGNSLTLTTDDSAIVHDNLSGFVANEHIDHSAVSITAGAGLTGGGTIAATRTVNVGAGSYIIVNANDVAVDATSTNTASKVVARDSSGNFAAGTITATATQATYADLAEKYSGPENLEPGDVVVFAGGYEVEACSEESDHRVAGVVSTDPAYLMNNDAEGHPIALAGRVPCKVTGPVAKGDLMVSSALSGHAKADNNAGPGRIIGKAIGSSEGGEAVIEVLVNMM